MSINPVKERPLPKYAQFVADEQLAALEKWETELFVLSGDDRGHLHQRVGNLLAFLEGHEDVRLKDLAFSLNTSFPAQGCRLAVVAGSVTELRNRLSRAKDRLADAKCEQIKDAAGVYFFAQPLHAPGSVALLFPGEGAQYLNMLADLFPHFPEMRTLFDEIDQLITSAGVQARQLSRILFLPPEATIEQRKAAEQKLRHLDIAMNSVLVADAAVFRFLQQLGLQADAMAGHSAGELAALCAADCIELDMSLLSQVMSTMTQMQQQEEEGDGPEAVLLAVGAGRDTVAEIIQRTVGNNAFLAMDNCPHQTVVVGLKEQMALVEAELQARRFLCERLSLRRPYHTFLFEPCLGPLHHLFAATGFRAPRTPVYSCTTANLFPPDPAEIRRLTVAHWACPVEFTRMIEQMYADGVRLFVEAGPRGNLTAFVEDILRGRTFAAIPVNTQRRGGITQLNHMAAQLVAHQVPLQLEHFYRRRRPQRLEWEATNGKRSTISRPENRSESQANTPAPSPPPADAARLTLPADVANEPLLAPPPAASKKGPVMLNYWNVMEQFLDLQNEVMGQFLSRPRKKKAVMPTALEKRMSQALPASSAKPQTQWPLLGEIIRQEAGRELVMRRRLDLAEDLFVEHHTVGGRQISKINPEEHGLPVLPMTFSLEIMAEVANLLLPGKTVIGLKKIKLYRWLAYDDEEPTTIEVTARLLPERPTDAGATHQVQLEIKDLGNSQDEKPRGVTSQGIVLLGDAFPAAPAVDDFPLTDEYPSRITTSVLYSNLFHGPFFQGVRSLGRMGNEGIEGFCEVPDRSQLFRSTTAPQFLIDPVMADVVMHPLAGWHLEQPDQAGRILLPFELEKIDLFGPPPSPGTKVISRVHMVEATGRFFIHSIDALKPDGQLWCRMTRLKYWRFFVPFGDVNFHGSKDEYFISKAWPEALPAAPAPARCIRLDMPADQRQANMRLVTAKVTLTPREFQEFRHLKGPDRKLNDWLFGRIAAKDAVRVLWHARFGERFFPADIDMVTDAQGRWTMRHRGSIRPEALPTVSYAHVEDIAVGLAAFCPYVGIEIVRIQPREEGFTELAFTADEREILSRLSGDRDEWIARLFSAKEAVARALGHQMIEGPLALTVRDVQPSSGQVAIALGPLLAASFPALANATLLAYTVRQEDLVVATTFCERGSS